MNLPASSYLLASYFFRSQAGNSRSESDFRTFTYNAFLFSPHYSNFGIVGHYTASGSETTNIGRAGLYYRYLNLVGKNVTSVIPMILLPAASSESGRFATLAIKGFYDGLLFFNGSLNYTWSPNSKIIAADPGLNVRLYQTLSLFVSYNYSKTDVSNNDTTTSTTTTSNNVGIEIKTVF